METDQLTHMANRIGEFFESFPDHAQAVAGTADHIQKFWAPSMRQVMLDALAHNGAPGLSPLAREALLSLTRESSQG